MSRYRVGFKSHRLAERTYVVEAETKAAAFFLAAALRHANWVVNEPPMIIEETDG